MEDNGLFYEDFQIGDKFLSPSRTITETDVVNFAGLSGDYNLLHVDREYAKNTVFQERIAHGLLGLSISSGLFTRTELNRRMSKNLIALLGLESWKFLAPIKINDTINLEIEIVEMKETSKKDRGIVKFVRKIINQNGMVVQEGVTPMMIARRQN
ncbi:acyl dehydratase [Sporosarcina sp. P21c]|uniref:MaoC/PaaZ C-terminal domain-containing protein n=1 Tax=Sporosarcina TaxID=1569 RepID=UPI000A16894D|nr:MULTISPECIES: MaoC/PaaZ C-terminal domain-containing protein [Sporosarcina]ARJ37914.1 acyl dehydratase [Sporosarcina ureae]PIC67771.1 acyl dehydratase [Sporosarcina sp. P16a]PIC83764.1 acyl dehydratase [Sporosarcina sp. P1]PIC90630.1 acyl dehydratase [Sporosarcina sp. P21c]PIC93396.1 acyl dehydratase [Sporosarcina sp. P25]